MSEQIQLPFWVPKHATVLWVAAPGLVMEHHPSAYNLILTQATTIACHRKFLRGYTSPQISIPRIGIPSYHSIERYEYNLRFLSPCIHTMIKDMLKEGFYVYYFKVDDFYLPGKSWYGTSHMHHDGIICGYDESDQTYTIAGYDLNWVLRPMKIPQECFMRGLESSLEAKQYGTLIAYRGIDGEYPLDEAAMATCLREHIEADFTKYPMEVDDWAYGSIVFDLLAMYIDRLKDGRVPHNRMDWRSLRPVWEHCACMLERIEVLEKNHSWDSTLSDAYQPIVDLANRMRMMYAMYHKNQRLSLLDPIKAGLGTIKEDEKRIISTLLEKMEQKA